MKAIVQSAIACIYERNDNLPFTVAQKGFLF